MNEAALMVFSTIIIFFISAAACPVAPSWPKSADESHLKWVPDKYLKRYVRQWMKNHQWSDRRICGNVKSAEIKKFVSGTPFEQWLAEISQFAEVSDGYITGDGRLHFFASSEDFWCSVLYDVLGDTFTVEDHERFVS